jgi:ubiquinone/menaquinone biosynthesis C-methylase UbiE
VTYLLKIFFYLLYQPLSWTYDWVAAIVSAGYWQDWVTSILPDLPGPHLMELGHGPGHLQAALAKRGQAVIGLDRSTQMGRQARRRLHKQGLDFRLVRGQAEALPFPTRYFDQVFCTFPTLYIIQPATLAEVYRVLAPGGCWVILPDAYVTGNSLPERFSRLLFRFTGQSASLEGDEWLEPYQNFLSMGGFTVNTERRKIGSSIVIVITATVQ